MIIVLSFLLGLIISSLLRGLCSIPLVKYFLGWIWLHGSRFFVWICYNFGRIDWVEESLLVLQPIPDINLTPGSLSEVGLGAWPYSRFNKDNTIVLCCCNIWVCGCIIHFIAISSDYPCRIVTFAALVKSNWL